MMKFLIVVIFILNINADEIQRIDSIVKDIAQLRIDYQKSQKELNMYKNRVYNLENELKIAYSLLKIKEKKLSKTKQKKVICLSNDENSFPKLAMRKKIFHTKASTYRTTTKAFIYNDINGKKIDEWEKGISFTSNQKSENFIKITGYFENKVWVKAKKSLWIKSDDAYQRDVK